MIPVHYTTYIHILHMLSTFGVLLAGVWVQRVLSREVDERQRARNENKGGQTVHA